MKDLFLILKEQITHQRLIFQLAAFETKSLYQMHYLGVIWQILNPSIQIFSYWFVFGIGIRGGTPVGETPFFSWLIVGLIPWFFISTTITQGSNSVYSKIHLVSKMKFPVSVLPTISIVRNSYNFIVLLIIMGVILILNGTNPGIYILQLPYYLLSLFVLMYSLTLLGSTISVIIRDFQTALGSFMRLLFFLTPIFWDPSGLREPLLSIIKLNPFYYLINGFRNTLLNGVWFYEELLLTVYFWSFTLLILIIGSFMHLKFRHKFVDYL